MELIAHRGILGLQLSRFRQYDWMKNRYGVRAMPVLSLKMRICLIMSLCPRMTVAVIVEYVELELDTT